VLSFGTECQQSPSTGSTQRRIPQRKSKRKQQRHVGMTRQNLLLESVGKKTRGEKKGTFRMDIKTVPPSPCGGLAYLFTESFESCPRLDK